jgi:hypothetical protein
MDVEFTAHNIRLDDGTLTKPDVGAPMHESPWFLAARRVLETVFPGDKSELRIADLGCLEGGYAVEFARMGFQSVGIEVRDANIAACNYVKSKTDLPNLEFIQDDALNIAAHGEFDAVFCCGLLYHLDHPKRFVETLSSVTRRLLIIQTHVSTDTVFDRWPMPRLARKLLGKLKFEAGEGFALSKTTRHEGLKGRWYTEFGDDESFAERDSARWSSWDNRRSFWVQREYLLQAMKDAGFDCVLEQFDGLGDDIARAAERGFMSTDYRGTFVGIKT